MTPLSCNSSSLSLIALETMRFFYIVINRRKKHKCFIVVQRFLSVLSLNSIFNFRVTFFEFTVFLIRLSHEKYSELFWSAFSHIRTEQLRIQTLFTQCLCFQFSWQLIYSTSDVNVISRRNIVKNWHIIWIASQWTLACSKSTIEILKKLWNMFRVSNKCNKTMS